MQVNQKHLETLFESGGYVTAELRVKGELRVADGK